jgi:CRP-like cAMP-binding protein
MNTQSTLVLAQGSNPPKKPPTDELSQIWKSLIKLGTKVVLERKSNLFVAGDQNKHVYIVISGYLMLTKNNTLLDVVEPGQSLGAALLNSGNSKQTYPVSAMAIDQSEVLQLSAEVAFDLMNSDHSVNESIENLPVTNRIAFFLLQKKSLLKSTTITRKMIAQAVNTTPETVIRTLAIFEKQKIISYAGRKIILIDSNHLENLCL